MRPRPFFEFGGRGTRAIRPSKILHLEPDPGAVLLITKRVRAVEFVLCYCRSAIVERWGVYTIKAFRRACTPDLRRSWPCYLESELMIFHQVDLYLVPHEAWMETGGPSPS